MADDIVTRLRAHLARRDVTSRTHWDGCIDSHPICALAWALDEIERLRAEHDMWQATAAGLSQDMSNADDEIARLRAENDELRESLTEARSELAHLESDEARRG